MLRIALISSPAYAPVLHQILSNAFAPYKPLYTQEAYDATVLSVNKIRDRILSESYTVYGAFIDDQLAGTVTTRIMDSGDLYFMTMGVDPAFAGKGIGQLLLDAIHQVAMDKNCPLIRLETYAPLLPAIRLYERNGFLRTEIERDYSGIIVFEMVKRISP